MIASTRISEVEVLNDRKTNGRHEPRSLGSTTSSEAGRLAPFQARTPVF
jgi:hypothetical protein